MSAIEALPARATDFDIFATSIPARAFTGDFYYSAPTEDGFKLAVGDVAGKGLQAAVFMAMIHEELERLTKSRFSTHNLVRDLNRVLRQHMPRNKFATMAIAGICPEGALIVNAGHPPVLIRRASGTVDVISNSGPALGLFDEGLWNSADVKLEPGDSLLFYTDGLMEATSPRGQEFGMEGILDAFRDAPQAPADAVQVLIEQVRQFAGGAFDDDLTVLVARRRTGPQDIS